MFNRSLYCFSITIIFVFVRMLALSQVSVHSNSTKANTLRKLTPAVHSACLEFYDMWCKYKMPSDSSLSNIDFISGWTVSISSNETIIGNPECNLFSPDLCSITDCYEDNSPIYSVKQPRFSSNNVTRVNLTTNEISIADGAWKINSSLLYMHDCEYDPRIYGKPGAIGGQIGLGLSGKAYQNFQTKNPIFSIVLDPKYSAELIFGVDETYTSNFGAEVLLPCDADWKMQVNSMSFGDLIVSNIPVTMIFDIQSFTISLPEAYYYQLKIYFFQMSIFISCHETTVKSFWCMLLSDVHNFPSLVFSLGEGTEFILPPEAYVTQSRVVEFRLYNSTFSGVDYIILGYSIMSQYYTVFQLSDSQTPTITLYPLDSTTVGPTSPKTSSPSTPSNTLTNITSDPTLESENTSTVETNTPQTEIPANPPVISELNSSSSTHNSNESEKNQNLQYFVIGVLLIVLLSGFIVLMIRAKKAWLIKKEVLERSRSTVELGENSYFVSSSSNHDFTSNNDNNDQHE